MSDNNMSDNNNITSNDTNMTTSSNIRNSIFCSSCGHEMAADAAFCPKCGSPNKANPSVQSNNQNQSSGFNVGGAPAQVGEMVDGKIVKSKIVAFILAWFLGGFGGHKFYCGQIGMGVVYLIFCWTFIPAIIAFIEGIIYLTVRDDETFTKRYCI